MPKQQLDSGLLTKLQKAIGGKPVKYIREQICRKAGKQGISSLAAQIIWAKEHGIGTAHALNKLPADLRAEVRSGQPANSPTIVPRLIKPTRKHTRKPSAFTSTTIELLLEDDILLGRCKDLLLARRHFDRALREATTVLDDRLKTKSTITYLNPANLVGRALNPDPKLAILEISPEPDEQRGFHAICLGVMLGFRNKVHHSLNDKFTREDALKFCGFIDTILGMIERADLHLDRLHSTATSGIPGRIKKG
jgi:hypothetical protein